MSQAQVKSTENPDLADKIAQITNGIVQAVMLGRSAGFDPNLVYSRQSLLMALEIGQHTLEDWIARGLRVLRPGTRTAYFLGSDVVELMLKYPELSAKPDTENTEKKKKKPR